MPVLTESTPDVRPPVDTASRGTDDVPPANGESSGGEGEPRRGWPLGWAVLVTVALAALLTYLGMLTQIWANLAGSQLPGA